MNFEPEYTEEQQRFKQEIRAFLERNVPRELSEMPADPANVTYEQYRKQRELGRKLGEKGWLYPTYPKEYGGGGFSVDHAAILEEELDDYGLSLPPYYDSGGRMGGATILVWGNEEQKKRFLPPIMKGEKRSWQLLTEPEAGSDLANVKTQAIRDGDDYVINGQKIFIGSSHGADQYWTLTCTNPRAPRHQNLSWFMIPADLPGITVGDMELLAGGGEAGAASGIKHTIYFDNVRVPAFNLVGGENQGWRAAGTHLEVEHGGGGALTRNRLLERLFKYCKETKRNGKPLSKDPDVRDLLADIYIESEITRLLGRRNFWLAYAKKPRSYEGPQFSYYRKTSGLKVATLVHQILGPYALTHDPQWGPVEGHIEYYMRAAIIALHPGGTTDIQKVIMARRIGIGRTVREEAGALS